MPLFNNDNKDIEKSTTLQEDIERVQQSQGPNDFINVGIDYVKDMKKKLSKEKYIEFLENELEMSHTALMRAVRFASALDVVKAEKIGKLK